MATVLHNLTDVELLRMARTSPLMDCPLFAEMADRFEVETENNNFNELKFQQNSLARRGGGAKRGGA